MPPVKLPILALFLFLSFAASGACNLNAGNNVSVCQNSTLQITVTATGNPTVVWSSNPSNIISSGGNTLTVTVNTSISPGAYTLIVNGNSGQCADTVIVTINPLPTPSISPAIVTICDGTIATLTASGGGTYVWSGSLGTNPMISTSPSSTTTYSVTVTDVNSCSATASKIVTVNPTPLAAITGGNNAVCPGISTALTASGGGAYLWSNSLGTNSTVTVTPPTTSNYTVTVTAANGCTATAQKTVTILLKPDAAIANYAPKPFTNCGGGATFNLVVDNISNTTSTNSNYDINWGDGSADYNSSSPPTALNHQYNGLGYFTLTLTVTGQDGCISTKIYSVFNGSNPAVSFGNPGSTVELCIPYTLSFPISGTNNNPPGTIYVITKNDGTPNDTFIHPPPADYIHTFSITSCGATGGIDPNTFYVRIKAENPCGNSTATIEPITTNEVPVANFKISPDTIACVNSTLIFTNTSIPGATVDNNGVCDTTTANDWSIYPNTGWTLLFGSLLGSNPLNPYNPTTWGSHGLSVQFNTPGIYQIRLRVQGTNTCGEDSITKTVCIQAPPNPTFTLNTTTGCAPLIISPTNSTVTTNTCGPTTYLWTVTQTSSCIQDSTNSFVFISGTNPASVNPVIRFNNQGIYTITLSVTNVCGTITTLPQSITVKRKPEVTLSGVPAFLCVGLSINPSATTLPCLGTITTYAWSFPGGSPSSANTLNPGTITYSTSGTFTASLAVTNECGTTTVTAPITIQNAPVAVAGNDQSYCSGGTAQIGSANVVGYTYSWSPATGLSSTTVSNPTVTLTANGTTTVTQTYTVTVTNQAGCTGTDVVIVTVYPPAIVNAGPSVSMCNITPITLSGIFGGGATSVTWTSNNGGNFTNTSSPTSTYTPSISNGIIILTLTTDNPTGPCPAAADSLVITIFQPPIPNAGSDQSYCTGGSATIGSANVAGYTYSWSPSTGLSSTTVSNPTVTLTANGTTIVTQIYTVTVSNQAGCSATDAVTVNVYPPATVSAGPSVTICNINSTTLAGTFGGGATATVWTSNSGGTFSNPNSTTSTYTPPIAGGTIILTITTNDPNGPCPSVSDSMVVTAVQPPTANAGTDQQICSGGTVSIGGATQAGYTYNWTPAASVSNPTISNPTVTLTNNGSTVITQTLMLIVSAIGCADTDQVVVSVYPPAVVNAGVASSICFGDSVHLNGTISGAATSATWSSPNGTFTNATVLNTYFHPTITNGTATITITTNDPAGPCPLVTSTMIVTVNPIPTVNAVPNQTVCDGSPTTVVALTSPVNGTTFSWSGTSPNGITNFPTNGTSSSISSFAPNNPNTTAGTITYTITPTANGCVRTPITFDFTVNPDPNITTVPPQSVCSGQSHIAVSFSSSVVNTTYSWSASTTAGVSVPITSGNTSIPAQAITNTGTTNGTVTYTITPTANNCPGTPSTFVVTVYPVPTVNTIPPQTICSGGQTTLVAPSSPVSGATFTWTATPSANTNGFATSGNGNIPTQTINYTGVTQGTVTYTITPTANGCPGTPLNFVVTVYPIPTVTANPIIDTICSGTQTNISLSSNVAAATFSWTVIQPASVSGATAGTGNSIQQTLTNTSSAAQQVTFTVTPSINNCPGTPIVVSIWVYPGITVSFSPPHQFICSSGTSVLVNITSPTAGVAFTWTSQANGVTGVTASGTNTIPAQTLGNSTSAPIDVVYLITANYAGCITQNANDSITVNPIPTVTTNPLSQTVCEGIPTQIINLTSAVAGTTFTWSGASSNGITGFTPSGNTNTIPAQTLNNPNNTPGTVVYSITPTANGCPGSPVNYIITVNPTPNIILPADTAICNGNSTNAIPISSSVAGTNFSWTSIASAGTSGNAPNGNGNIPVQTLSNINNSVGTVTYTITANASTCISTATYTISVNPSPTVVFSLPNQIICSGTSSTQVNLTSSTPGANISWTANVPAGITGASTSGTTTIAAQNLTNITFQPLTITYTAQAVTSGITCPGAISTYTVRVNPLPDLSITPTLDTICSASQTNIQLSSNVAGTVFTWAVNFPPNVSGQSPGTGNSIAQILLSTDANPQTVTYSITTNAATCPGQSGSSSVIVYPSPTVQFSLPDQTICSGFATQAIQITSPTAGAVITWIATVPVAITGASLSGTTTIPIQTLINSSNIPQQVLYNASVNFSACPGLANTYTVTVNPTPHITNTDTLQTICSGDLSNAIPLLSDVAGATFSWSGTGSANLSGFLPNGTTSTIPSQAISNSSNVSDTVLFVVIPTAAGCVGPPQQFQIAVNPRPIISLTPDTQALCTNNLSVPITITSNVAATNFTWTSTSTFVSGAILNGTGNTIPAQTLQNTSPQADTGFVVITVVPIAAGCPGQSINAFIQVNPTPVVNFAMNISSGCSPLHVSFATNTLAFGNPDSLIFSWGDGTPNTVLHPNLIQPIWSTITHIFSDTTSSAITYTISLTANNDCGDTTVSQTVTVQPNTINAFFTPSVTTGCEPLTVSFSDFSTGATFASWCFNYDLVNDTCLGNAEVVNPGTTVENTFNAGTYVVALYITNGCSQDTAFQTILVTPSPTVNFTYTNNACENLPITFTEQSVAPPGTFLTAFTWQFGDGDSLSGNIVAHSYDSAGNYTACLKVTASNGCAAIQCYPVTVLLKPVVAFVGYDTCVNKQPIQFVNNSIGATFYIWNFGDGNTSVAPNPANIYTTPGNFTVTLIGSTNTCSDTVSHQFIVYPKPIADFGLPVTYICGIPAQVQITNNSSGAQGYVWSIGNNSFSTAVNPEATFTSSGNFIVTLVAANQFNCYDTAYHGIDVYPFPVINSINVNPFEGCQPLHVIVNANVTNGNLFIWNLGDGSSDVSTTTPQVSYTYQYTGTYSITLTAYSFLTCGDTVLLSDTVKVHVTPVAAFDTLINSNSYPFDGTVVFINQSRNANTYQWNFGDGFNSIDTNPIHKYEQVDSFTVTLIAATTYPCYDTTSKTFYVIKKALYVPNALEPNYGGSDTLVKIWKPIGIGLRDYHAQVFDKWGRLLWESSLLNETAPAEGWDGTYSGIRCQEDVYVWKVDGVFMDGEIWPGMTYKKDEGGGTKRVGSITLIR